MFGFCLQLYVACLQVLCNQTQADTCSTLQQAADLGCDSKVSDYQRHDGTTSTVAELLQKAGCTNEVLAASARLRGAYVANHCVEGSNRCNAQPRTVVFLVLFFSYGWIPGPVIVFCFLFFVFVFLSFSFSVVKKIKNKIKE